MPNIVILYSSAVQKIMKGEHVLDHPETLALKSNLLYLVNQLLKQNFEKIGAQAICAVLHLAALEVGIPEKSPIESQLILLASSVGGNMIACGHI
jgi:hypothetical protein